MTIRDSEDQIRCHIELLFNFEIHQLRSNLILYDLRPVEDCVLMDREM